MLSIIGEDNKIDYETFYYYFIHYYNIDLGGVFYEKNY